MFRGCSVKGERNGNIIFIDVPVQADPLIGDEKHIDKSVLYYE